MRKQAGKHYHYFEFNEAMRNQAKWFADDGLHLTPEAYAMLNKFYQPVIERWTGAHYSLYKGDNQKAAFKEASDWLLKYLK